MALTLSPTIKTNMMAQINAAAGTSAVLTLYSGTRPATGGTATTALAVFTCNATAFGTVSGRVLTALPIASVTAVATGTATWARLTSSGGTFVADMNVGTGGAELTLTTTAVSTGATISITSCTISASNSRFNKVLWGLNGHWDYPESTATVIAALKLMGCTVYRMAYEGSQASLNAITAMAAAFAADGTGLQLYVCLDISYIDGNTGTYFATPAAAHASGQATGIMVAQALAPYSAQVMCMEMGNEMSRKGGMVSISYIMGTWIGDFTQANWYALAGVVAGAMDGARSILPHVPMAQNCITFAEYAMTDMLWTGENPDGTITNEPIKWDVTALHSYYSWGDPVNISYDGDGSSRFNLYDYLASAYGRPIILSEWGADATGPMSTADQITWNNTMVSEMYARREALGGAVQIRSAIFYELYNTDYPWGVVNNGSSTVMTPLGVGLAAAIAAHPDV